MNLIDRQKRYSEKLGELGEKGKAMRILRGDLRSKSCAGSGDPRTTTASMAWRVSRLELVDGAIPRSYRPSSFDRNPRFLFETLDDHHDTFRE